MNNNNGDLAHTLKMAIAAKCKDCVAGMIEELNACEISDCPLHAHRPHYKVPPPKPKGLKKVGRGVSKRGKKKKRKATRRKVTVS